MAEIDGTWFGDGYFGYALDSGGYPDESYVLLAVVFGPHDEYTGTRNFEYDLAGDIQIEQTRVYDITIEDVS